MYELKLSNTKKGAKAKTCYLLFFSLVLPRIFGVVISYAKALVFSAFTPSGKLHSLNQLSNS